MILKAECTGRLEPWSELGSGMGVGGVGVQLQVGQQEEGGCAGPGPEGQSALTDWLSLFREPDRTRTGS